MVDAQSHSNRNKQTQWYPGESEHVTIPLNETHNNHMIIADSMQLGMIIQLHPSYSPQSLKQH